MKDNEIVQPAGWPRPQGYSNAVTANGRIIAVSGQIGWNPETCEFETDDFVEQVRISLENLVTVLRAAGAEPHHVIRMTWYITDREVYAENAKRIGEVYRGVFGKIFPAMSVVVVAGLLEARARVEIEATAVVRLGASAGGH